MNRTFLVLTLIISRTVSNSWYIFLLNYTALKEMHSYSLVRQLLLLLSLSIVCCFALDCRKFVFAPVCRGIIAKRAELGSRIRSNSFAATDTEPASEDVDQMYLVNQKPLEDTERPKHQNRMSVDTIPFPMLDYYNSASRNY